ncbi:ABC transporter permease [Sneathiella sp. CAU 1612]|uniref:ABC transporter permease n=1 Tax=Sneathiella sedimenti TaxID=2816034 RepID=A0ABS3F762_9PROT|nr:ABC transporter permease [Sneathiella sedimenti]MBO0334209.1 ABC transporter permease [Sneathiella sedimenti]
MAEEKVKFGAPLKIPGWVNYALIPLVNLIAALLISGVVILIIGDNPIEALKVLIYGAFGYPEAVGYTLYYTTNFIFTGLAVAIAFHCGLFNIGAEGQAALGGIGVGLVCLYMDWMPLWMIIPFAMGAAAIFGAAWAYIPAYLQAKRGSHIVITTIMFNFIAASLMTYLLVEVLIDPNGQSPESRPIIETTWLPYIHEVVSMPKTPLNLSFVYALILSAGFYFLVWHTRWGYEIRVVGQNETAARYAGISPSKNIILAMMISGALAGFVGVNEIQGVHHRLILDFTGGYGFAGIAVALMGRNHPIGIFLAALLFGALYQGGSELAFEMKSINKEMVIVIQGLIILFSGALEHMFRPKIEAIYRRFAPARPVEAR